MGDLPSIRSLPGIVVATEAGLAVNVQGAMPPAKWPAGYIPTAGDAVDVWMLDGTARVLGPVIAGQRPGEGTVSGSASGGKVPVDTSAGTLLCRFMPPAPSLGSLVFLDWQQTTPRILGAAEAAPDPAPPPAPSPAPPKRPDRGTTRFSAIDSRTYQVGSAWGFRGLSVVQWRYGSNRENRGAWFYGNGPTQLAGRTITKFSIRLGARQRIGSYNSPLVAHLYRTTNRTRPGGDVNRVAGPHDVTIPVNSPARWVALPAEWGQDIVDGGGGIGIAGSPYLGFDGIDVDPASGQLAFDWRK